MRNALLLALLFISSAAPLVTAAQNVPGSADPSRIEPLKQPVLRDGVPASEIAPSIDPEVFVPETAKAIRFVLQEVQLDGVTAFTEAELRTLYQDYLDREISLDVVWMIAGRITQAYRDAGYFLSRAHVPAQAIDRGTVTIYVAEGYIADVNIVGEEGTETSILIQKLSDRLKTHQPINAYELEAFMLQLNGLPGKAFGAFVEAIEGAGSGVSRLVLQPKKEVSKTSFRLHNSGSRFLGPYQAVVAHQDSFLPLQQTTLSAASTIPTDEMAYFAFRHIGAIYPDWELELSGSYVASNPGATLAPSGIESSAIDLAIAINWQPLRQRQKNLILSLELAGQNSNGDILQDTPLTRDRIRALRSRLSFDSIDSWKGYNYIDLSLHQGVELLGANEDGDLNLSRAEAEPDFTKVQFSYTRQQALAEGFMAIGQLAGQRSSGPLFSAEEFGYGGQSFGRAYDPSEITGDHGLAASIELRYLQLDTWKDITLTPYTFYDIGKVWNEDRDGINGSASSAGLGMVLQHPFGVTSNIGLAWPLTRDIASPIYGNASGPRVLFHLEYGF